MNFELFITVFGLLLLLLFLIIIIYNGLIRKRNQVKNALSASDIILKKRYDLIPNLISSVKSYMAYEQNLFEEITELRNKAFSLPGNTKEKNEIESKISKIGGKILVSAENYPDLKTNENFLQLQSTWTEIEEQISAARRSYSASVTDYNNSVQSFPSNIIAGFMKYQVIPLFDIPSNEKTNPDAKELFK